MREQAESVGKFVAKVTAYKGDADDAFTEYSTVAEITDTGVETEIVLDEGKVRRYVRFRTTDFRRAVKEMAK